MGAPPPQGYRIGRLLVVSTEGPLDFARGKLRPERRDQFQSQSILRICASSGRMSFAGRYAREGRGPSVLPAQAAEKCPRLFRGPDRWDACGGRLRTRTVSRILWARCRGAWNQVPAPVGRRADFLIVNADAADLATAQ